MTYFGFNLMQWMWLLVGLQFILFGAGWAVATGGLPELRRAKKHFAVFNIANGLALALVAMRGQVSPLLSDMLPDILALLGFIRLWTGATNLTLARALQATAKTMDETEPWSVFVIGVSAIIVFCMVHIDAQLRVSSLLLCMAWIFVRGGFTCHSLLKSDGFSHLGRAVLALGAIISFVLIMHSIYGIYHQAAITYHEVTPSTIVLPFVLLACAMATNLLFAITVTGKVVRELTHQSRHDTLTGLPNRRAAIEFLDTSWNRFKSDGEKMAVVCFDIDHFKHVNDRFGHRVGDQVLAAIASHMQKHMRKQDLLARTGGEEFCAIFPNTSLKTAAEISERLRATMNSSPNLHPIPGEYISVSAGLVDSHERDVRLDDLLVRADKAMYSAKQAGRNRLAVEANHAGSYQFDLTHLQVS